VSESFDLNALLGQAMQMQEQLLAAQAETANAEVTGRAGGGAVTITVTGGLDFRRVEIRSDAVDPDDVGMLEDLVLAALKDAMDQLGQTQQSSLGGLDLAGLPGLGDLAGGLGGGAGLGLQSKIEGDVAIDAYLAEDDGDDDLEDGEDDEPGTDASGVPSPS
jgi:DNA-binding YbaB/EbfC family protein